MKKAVSCFLGLCLLLFGLPGSLPAQESTAGSLTGRVRDEQGRPLVGATIELRLQGTDMAWEILTDRNGRFEHRPLGVGRYEIEIRRGNEILWTFPFQVSFRQRDIQVEIDIQKLWAVAAAHRQFLAELERRKVEENRLREAQAALQRQHNRGVRSLREGNPEKAITDFNGVLEQAPNRTVTRAMLAAAYAADNRLPEAITAYRNLLEGEPKAASHHNNLAILLVRTGRVEEAFNHFRRARKLDKAQAATYEFNLAAALFNAGRYKDAGSHFRNAVRRDPTMAVAHYFYGVSLIRQGARGRDRSRAVKALRRYLQLAPDGPYAGLARNHLQGFGAAGVAGMLSPDVTSGEGLE